MTAKLTRFDALDARAMDHYREHGYVVVRGLIPLDLVNDLLKRTDDILDGKVESLGVHHFGAGSNRGPNDPGRLNRQIVVIDFPAKDPVFDRCAGCPALLNAVSMLLDYPTPTIFQLQAMVKDPGSNNPTPWHQDDGYWRLGDRDVQAVTAWMPLLRTTAADGTMWILPDSHKASLLEHGQAGGVSDYRTIAQKIDESRLVPLELEPGDVSFHHQRTVHGAHPNNGTRRRAAIATHNADVANPWEVINGASATR